MSNDQKVQLSIGMWIGLVVLIALNDGVTGLAIFLFISLLVLLINQTL